VPFESDVIINHAALSDVIEARNETGAKAFLKKGFAHGSAIDVVLS